MTKVYISKLTTWYNSSDTLEGFTYNCGIGSPIGRWDPNFLAGHAGVERKLEDIAENILFTIYYNGVDDPVYDIQSSEGPCPLNEGEKKHHDLDYTRKPDPSVKTDLVCLLHDPTLIFQIKARVKKRKKNPLKIRF